MIFERAAFWRRFRARWWEAFRPSKVRLVGASLALRRAMRVDWVPRLGSPRRLSSGFRKRGWAFAHLRGGGGTGLARFGDIVRLGEGELEEAEEDLKMRFNNRG
jgi:hypothetical protein